MSSRLLDLRGHRGAANCSGETAAALADYGQLNPHSLSKGGHSRHQSISLFRPVARARRTHHERVVGLRVAVLERVQRRAARVPRREHR